MSESRVDELINLDVSSLTYEQAMCALEKIICLLMNPRHENNNDLYEKAESIKAHGKKLLAKERSEIIRIARANNIPLSQIGIEEYSDDE